MCGKAVKNGNGADGAGTAGICCRSVFLRDIHVVDYHHTEFVDSSKPCVGSHQMIGVDTQGRGENHRVDGEQTVRGL